MEFLINVLPNNKFTNGNVKQFILNIEDQHKSNVTLVFKRVPSLTSNLVNFIKNSNVNSLIIKRYSDVDLDIHQQTYWINLHVTDCLLPNAITQWQQIICRHSSNVFEITYLKNELPLIEQTNKILKRINSKHPVRVNTIKNVLRLPLNIPLFNLSLSSQLLMMLGLQNYKVMDTLDRYKELNNPYLGTNFLVYCTQKLLVSLDSGLINTLVNVIINQPEIVKINLPTVILSKLNLRNRVAWFKDACKAAKHIGDSTLLNQYRTFLNDQIIRFKKTVAHSSFSRFTKHHLMSRLNQVNHTLLQVK